VRATVAIVALALVVTGCVPTKTVPPTVDLPGRAVLSADQLEYLDDHYRSWLVPCLRTHGVTMVGEIPRRGLFTRYGDAWSPYDAAIISDIGEWGRVTDACGDPYGGLLEGSR